jgi:hypothetical protein
MVEGKQPVLQVGQFNACVCARALACTQRYVYATFEATYTKDMYYPWYT